MENKYIIQMIGVLLVFVPAFVLGIYAIFEGRLGRRRFDGEMRQAMFVPINLFTTVLVLLMALGIFVLIASGFNACEFLAHWMPASVMKQLRPFTSCR